MIFRVTVSGLRELDRGLDLLARGRYIARGLERASERTVGVARETRFRTGGGPAVEGILTRRTGRLQRSIRVRRGRSHRKGGGAAFHDVIFGAGGRYGALHELGTRRMPQRPVLRPAVETASGAFVAIFLEELDREIAASFAASA